MADDDKRHVRKATPEERAHAELHATVWANTWDKCRYMADRYGDQHVDTKQMQTLATFAMIIGGEYRKIVNGADIDL